MLLPHRPSPSTPRGARWRRAFAPRSGPATHERDGRQEPTDLNSRFIEAIPRPVSPQTALSATVQRRMSRRKRPDDLGSAGSTGEPSTVRSRLDLRRFHTPRQSRDDCASQTPRLTYVANRRSEERWPRHQPHRQPDRATIETATLPPMHWTTCSIRTIPIARTGPAIGCVPTHRRFHSPSGWSRADLELSIIKAKGTRKSCE